MRTNARWFLLFLLIALPGSLLADTLETVYFRGNMSPANEVPPVTNESANATGRATITFHLRRNGRFSNGERTLIQRLSPAV